MKRILILAACLALAAGCAENPQVPGPAIISGSLEGTIAGDRFQDKRGWFSVTMPFKLPDVGYRYTELQESYPQNISYAAFSSPVSPGEYYRIYTEDFFASNHQVPDMDHVADAVLQVYGRQLVAARTTPIELQQEKPWKLGDAEGLMRLYTQKVPTELLSLDIMQNPGLAEDYTAYILMYVTARNGKVAMLWAEWPEDCGVCAPLPAGTPAPAGADAIDKALTSDTRVTAFLDSFVYGAAASAYQ